MQNKKIGVRPVSKGNRSVLTGYAIQHNLDGMSYDEVWDELVETQSDGVTCREVLHFDLAPRDLASLLRKGELRDVIDEMRSVGANFVLVGPVVGRPLDGLGI
jgi:hypothetical protein